MPNIRWLLGLVTVVHRFLYRVSGGRIGGNLGLGRKMLLLRCRGRRSGAERVIPLLYHEDGERLLLVASNAGDDRHPAWWLNLQAHPDASVQLGRRSFPVRARAAGPEEREALWPRLVASYAPYDAYRQRTSREIPVVILERTSPAP